MNDEKKPITMDEALAGPITLVETDEGPFTNDPTADELVVMDLQKQIKDHQEREIHLEYQLSGASDVLRMNTAARILSAISPSGPTTAICSRPSLTT